MLEAYNLQLTVLWFPERKENIYYLFQMQENNKKEL